MIETFKASVRDLSHKGLGVIDHPDGRVFFVRNVWPGDEGTFQIEAHAKKYDEAELISLDKSSADRVKVRCEFRGPKPGQCGGCPWMMATYESQLIFKVKRLKHALLKRRVEVNENAWQAIIESPNIFGYRNRAQLKTDGERLGYVSEGTSVLAPVENCYILNSKLNSLFLDLKKSLPREEFRPSGGHKWCFIDIDDELELQALQINKRRPFRQGNTEQNQKMREWVKQQFSKIPNHFPVIDLFCGSGNFTEVLSELGSTNILAVEVQGSALEELKKKNLPGVRILGLDMNIKGAWSQIAKHQPHAKAILIDPPREGLDKRKGLHKYLDNLGSIFYISCELDTFSIDVSDLTRSMWTIKEITPIDLFPHTPHVEIMSVLKREKLP